MSGPAVIREHVDVSDPRLLRNPLSVAAFGFMVRDDAGQPLAAAYMPVDDGPRTREIHLLEVAGDHAFPDRARIEHLLERMLKQVAQ